MHPIHFVQEQQDSASGRALGGGGGGAGGGRAHPDELLQERGDFSEHVAEAAGDISTQGDCSSNTNVR